MRPAAVRRPDEVAVRALKSAVSDGRHRSPVFRSVASSDVFLQPVGAARFAGCVCTRATHDVAVSPNTPTSKCVRVLPPGQLPSPHGWGFSPDRWTQSRTKDPLLLIRTRTHPPVRLSEGTDWASNCRGSRRRESPHTGRATPPGPGSNAISATASPAPTTPTLLGPPR
jgi:hypothetical protein